MRDLFFLLTWYISPNKQHYKIAKRDAQYLKLKIQLSRLKTKHVIHYWSEVFPFMVKFPRNERSASKCAILSLLVHCNRGFLRKDNWYVNFIILRLTYYWSDTNNYVYFIFRPLIICVLLWPPSMNHIHLWSFRFVLFHTKYCSLFDIKSIFCVLFSWE